MTDPTTPDDEANLQHDEKILEGPLSGSLDNATERLEQNRAAVAAGHALENVLMPGREAHMQALLSDLDAEAAADKKMLAEMPAAFHDHPPLEEAGVDLNALTAVDPTFSDEAFIAIARETFYKVREARSLEDPKEGEALLSPGMESELTAAVSGDVASHRHHLLPLLEITAADIVSATVADGKERVVVCYRLSGEELDRDERGNVVAGDTTLHTWDEDWTFERDPSVDTSVSDEQHILSFTDTWMVAHRGWVVTAIQRAPLSLPT